MLLVEHVGDGDGGWVGHASAAPTGSRSLVRLSSDATSAGPTLHPVVQTCQSGKSNASASTTSAREKTNAPHAAAQTCQSGKWNDSASTAPAREKTNGGDGDVLRRRMERA